MKRNQILLLIGLNVFLSNSILAKTVQITFDKNSPQITFASGKIADALKRRNHTLTTEGAEFNFVFSIKPSGKKPESFSIQKDGNDILIVGQDAAGAMYGGLEVAELIDIGDLSAIKPVEQTPYLAMRGTKLNLPLDVRTPSYSDVGDAFQVNMPEVWNFDFWKAYIDHIAGDRYNLITIWSLNPFPSMVKTPGYEDIALDDVRRSTTKFKEYYGLTGREFGDPEILNNYEVIKKITIE